MAAAPSTTSTQSHSHSHSHSHSRHASQSSITFPPLSPPSSKSSSCHVHGGGHSRTSSLTFSSGPTASAHTQHTTHQSLLGSSHRSFLHNSRFEQVDISSLRGKIVGLFFGAASSGPSRAFSSLLSRVWDELQGRNEKFEVVFISFDRTQDEYVSNYRDMAPWLSLPFDDRTCRRRLVATLQVTAIPTLIFLDEKGGILNRKGKALVASRGADGYPFKPDLIVEGQLRRSFEAELLELFAHLDRSGAQKLCGDDIVFALQMGRQLPASAISACAQQIIHDMDTDGDSWVTLPEFRTYFQKMARLNGAEFPLQGVKHMLGFSASRTSLNPLNLDHHHKHYGAIMASGMNVDAISEPRISVEQWQASTEQQRHRERDIKDKKTHSRTGSTASTLATPSNNLNSTASSSSSSGSSSGNNKFTFSPTSPSALSSPRSNMPSSSTFSSLLHSTPINPLSPRTPSHVLSPRTSSHPLSPRTSSFPLSPSGAASGGRTAQLTNKYASITINPQLMSAIRHAALSPNQHTASSTTSPSHAHSTNAHISPSPPPPPAAATTAARQDAGAALSLHIPHTQEQSIVVMAPIPSQK